MRGKKIHGCGSGLLALTVVVTLALALGAAVFFLRLTKVAPAPESGFQWPYYLFTPLGVEDDRLAGKTIHLLVLPNNTGTTSDDPAVHDQAALATAFLGQLAFGDLDVAILVPAFPRFESSWQVYTHAIDRDSLTTEIPGLRRIDLQMEAMIDDAQERLGAQGWTVDRKVLMMGFSASGMFVNRFAVLHPDRVRAAVVGSPGGWPIAPAAEWEGALLRYPIGVSDLEHLTGSGFDLESFREIPLLFFIGGQDTNDSVPFKDSYDDEDRPLINGLFGDTPVARWDDAEAIYASIGADADFRVFPGVGHAFALEELTLIREFFARILADDAAM